jgi:hypothetical protein
MNKKEMYIDFFLEILKQHKNGIINEYNYIKQLQDLNSKGFKTYHVKNFGRVAKELKELGFVNSYRISVVLGIRDTLYRNILINYWIFYDKIKIIDKKVQINESENDFELVEGVETIFENVKRILDICFSFQKMEMKKGINTGTIVEGKSITLKEDNIEKWEMNSREEIMNRLHKLNEIFTKNQMIFMGVELQFVSIIEEMCYDEIEEYYLKVINMIINFLLKWSELCQKFLLNEKRYTNICKEIINQK